MVVFAYSNENKYQVGCSVELTKISYRLKEIDFFYNISYFVVYFEKLNSMEQRIDYNKLTLTFFN